MPTIPSWLQTALTICDTNMKNPPEAYGPFHLGFFIGGLALSLLLAWLLRNRSQKTIRIILFSIGVVLCLSEVWKQLLHIYCFTPPGTYKWWVFPFQLCSVPMYLLLIAPVIKQGRVSRALYTFMMLYNLLGGFMAYLVPTALNNGGWFLTLHSYLWHMLLIFVGLLLHTTRFGGRTMKDYAASSVAFVAFCGVAIALNVTLFEASGGKMNNFEIGPSKPNMPIFSDVWQSCGWHASAALYIFAVCLGAFLIFLPIYISGRKAVKKTAPAMAT